MDITHEQEDNKGLFIAASDGKKAGEMTYSRAGDQLIIIDHTDVEEDFRGQGVGDKLVREAVQFARDNNIKIVPLCPFARSVFRKNEDISDVLR